MLAAYCFNTQYKPISDTPLPLPSLRLLEGGKFEPGQYAPVLVKEYGQIRLKFFQWGLVPAWTKAQRKRQAIYWAPGDQVFTHPAYQVPVRRQRCLIPSDGYYVDRPLGASQEQFKFLRPDGDTFCFAGIYDCWQTHDGSLRHTFAIVTAQAPGDLSQYNVQMPLMLNQREEKLWLNPHTNFRALSALLRPKQTPILAVYPVKELQNPTVTHPTQKSLAA